MKYRFLLIDDDVTVNRAAKEVLKLNFDCDVDAVTDPEEGFHLFLQNKDAYSMILCDLQMPKMDGLQLSRLVRLESSTVPIVILTAYASEEAYDEACSMGVNEFVNKPFKPAAFSELIKKMLEAHDRKFGRMKGFESQFWEQVEVILGGKIPAGFSSLDFIIRVLKKNAYEPEKVLKMAKMVPLLKTEISYLEARDNYMYLKTLQDQRVDRIRMIQRSIKPNNPA